eukprot:15484014-Alexandrium_andersonii.AAC.2
MHGCTDAWTHGCMGAQRHERIDARTHGRTHARMRAHVSKQVNGSEAARPDARIRSEQVGTDRRSRDRKVDPTQGCRGSGGGLDLARGINDFIQAHSSLLSLGSTYGAVRTGSCCEDKRGCPGCSEEPLAGSESS